MIRIIIDKIKDERIQLLNELIETINFCGFINPSYSVREGVLTERCYEFDFNNKCLTFFLDHIFEKGFEKWVHVHCGALRRYIWGSFFHEFISGLMKVSKFNIDLMEAAKSLNLNNNSEKIQKYKNKLIIHSGNSIHDYIVLKTDLWIVDIPKSLGVLDIFYNMKLDELKIQLARRLMSKNQRIKYFNELIKLKLDYKYEYTLSELVNLCIHSDHFESYFKYNKSQKIKKEYYDAAKGLILKFLNNHNIKLKKYEDSLGQIHYFLTHKIFERVKSVCLQICVQEIQIKSLDHYKRFKEFYSKCPVCGKEHINQINCEKIYFTNKFTYFKENLIEAMNQVDSLEIINNDEYFFGIPCEDCFDLTRNIQGKRSELKDLKHFLDYYKTCPICSNKNHLEYLISFYHDKSKKELRDSLIRNMKVKNKKNHAVNFQIGIPCCKCYEKVFGEKPLFLNDFY